MQRTAELALLIPLLEAESEQVRTQVRLSLLEYCPFLEEMLAQLELELTPIQQYQIHLIQNEYLSRNLKESWRRILSDGGGMHRLELVLDFVCHLQVDEYPYQPVGRLIDQLAQDYRRHAIVPDPIELARYLFTQRGISGARDDYDNPLNSNLCYVLNERKGIPIVLSNLFMLVGRRLGLKIDGVNLPGHFLAKTVIGGNNIIFDCFNGGRIMTAGELASHFFTPAVDFVDLLRNPPTMMDMARRLMRNLQNAYARRSNLEKTQLTEMLIGETQPSEFAIQLVEPSLASPAYRVGHLVRHSRYGYRGVIVDVDLQCQADDDWYRANLTQPDRHQPWYHVLVDGSKATTYAAQSNLETDRSEVEVIHPLVPFFFLGFANGKYIRNGEPWYWKKK